GLQLHQDAREDESASLRSGFLEGRLSLEGSSHETSRILAGENRPSAVFRCIACAATLTPPTPPSQGGESRRRLVFFPPFARGDTGGFFECLCVAPGSPSRRLKI